MHGSPKSKWDSKDIWKRYDYHQLGIEFEPYFDTDFSKTFYLTDTGRRWDGYKVSVRDKILGFQDEWIRQGLVFHSTDDVIRAIQCGKFPRKTMFTTHPQRWTNDSFDWLKEFFLQTVKNCVKRFVVRK